MAANLKVGETVFVPTVLLEESELFGTALTQRKVVAVQGRKAQVDLPNQQVSPLLAKSKLHRDLAILVLRIGDFDSEAALLDPLAKSILHFSRLFLDDHFVRLLQVRSVDELTSWLPANVARFSHMVIVGHCDAKGLKFSVGGFVPAQSLAKICGAALTRKITVISLACESGKASFARPFSQLPFCDAFIAPYHPIHGAVASQYCQNFFTHFLIQGRSLAISHRSASDATPGSTSFRLWKNGMMR